MLNSPLVVRSAWKTFYRVLDVSDLTFSKTARGGFESATFTMPHWVDTADPALTPGALVTVEDTRNGETVWQGYLDIPGKTFSDGGQSWQVGATGAKVVLGDSQRPYIPVDSSLEGWEQKYPAAPGSTASASSLPTNDAMPALLLQFPSGQNLFFGWVASMTYSRLAAVGQKLGGIQATRKSGETNSNFRMEYSIGGTTVLDQAFDTTPGGPGVREAGPDFGTTENAVSFRIEFIGGGVGVTDDDKWGAFYDVCVRALLTGQDGTEISGAGTYTDPYVLAHEIVVDALYWFTNRIVISLADIDTTFTHHFDQFAFPDGTRLPEVMDALALMEPEMVWKVGKAGLGGGGHTFTLAKYPTEPRYVIDGRDGWSQPSSELDLANRVRVYWTDKRGNTQSKVYTTTVPVLGVRLRDAEPVTLGEQVGTEAAADRVGPKLLEQMTVVPYSGVATIAHPIRDRLTGGMAQPWEIESGETVILADQPDAPPLRLTEFSFSDSGESAALTLGVPLLTTDQLVDRLAHPPRVRGSFGPIVIT